ncbi:MAG: hypothetical protein ACO1PM_27105 [Acidovorax sp.]|jgi:hypothetical protein
MPILAAIPRRTLLVSVNPDGSWSGADEGTPGAEDADLRFEISGEEGRGVLLAYASLDGRLAAADHWFATQGEAQAFAADAFGIEAQEWGG